MTQCTYGNGLEDNRSYDLQGRLVNQQLADALANIIDQRAYTYDKNSNILNIDTNTEDNGYVYDRLDRLTSDSIDDNNPFTYGYDLNDNRLSRQQGTGTEELDEWIDYIDNSNRIAHIDTFQRNAILPDLPDRDMVYNDAGRLYQLIEEGNLKASYIYNDMGQRTRKTIYQSDGTTVDNITIYHYDRMGMLVTETTETGVLMKDYIWNGGVIAAQIIATDAGNTGNAGAVTSEAIIYLYTDHLMTNRLATDDNQQVVWRWEGEAFGNTPVQELGGVSVNLRFPGQYYDEETNLHYNWNRYYDPVLGRYITSDPIGIFTSMNTYNYVESNPVIFYDFSGLVASPGLGDQFNFFGSGNNVANYTSYFSKRFPHTIAGSMSLFKERIKDKVCNSGMTGSFVLSGLTSQDTDIDIVSHMQRFGDKPQNWFERKIKIGDFELRTGDIFANKTSMECPQCFEINTFMYIWENAGFDPIPFFKERKVRMGFWSIEDNFCCDN